jgi:hypothetical protein
MRLRDIPLSRIQAKKKAVETAEIPLRCIHTKIVPTLCVGMNPWTLRVHCDAERHGRHSHAERGNDHWEGYLFGCGVRRRYGFTAR